MKKSFLFILFSVLIIGCNTYKSANKSLVSGDFNKAFHQALEAYIKNPNEKNGEKYLPLISEAYAKGQEVDENRLKELRNSTDPARFEDAYFLLVDLQNRQDQVQGINNRSVKGVKYSFKTKDYSKPFNTVKEGYANFLYEEGISFLNMQGKLNAQTAYDRFENLERLISNYKDTRSLMAKARTNGMYKVFIQLQNNTQMVIPKRLQDELLDFNSYGLDTKWTEFYTNGSSLIYDYTIRLSFEEINISPERELIQLHNFEKKIVDGKEKLIQNGKEVKDEFGNVVMVDRYITVKSRLEEYIQRKEANISARYYVIDNSKNQVLENKPMLSGFVFENAYARQSGDKRALERDYLNMIGRRILPFPPNEQMVYDCGQDLKNQFKREVKRMKL